MGRTATVRPIAAFLHRVKCKIQADNMFFALARAAAVSFPG